MAWAGCLSSLPLDFNAGCQLHGAMQTLENFCSYFILKSHKQKTQKGRESRQEVVHSGSSPKQAFPLSHQWARQLSGAFTDTSFLMPSQETTASLIIPTSCSAQCQSPQLLVTHSSGLSKTQFLLSLSSSMGCNEGKEWGKKPWESQVGKMEIGYQTKGEYVREHGRVGETEKA